MAKLLLVSMAALLVIGAQATDHPNAKWLCFEPDCSISQGTSIEGTKGGPCPNQQDTPNTQLYCFEYPLCNKEQDAPSFQRRPLNVACVDGDKIVDDKCCSQPKPEVSSAIVAMNPCCDDNTKLEECIRWMCYQPASTPPTITDGELPTGLYACTANDPAWTCTGNECIQGEQVQTQTRGALCIGIKQTVDNFKYSNLEDEKCEKNNTTEGSPFEPSLKRVFDDCEGPNPCKTCCQTTSTRVIVDDLNVKGDLDLTIFADSGDYVKTPSNVQPDTTVPGGILSPIIGLTISAGAIIRGGL